MAKRAPYTVIESRIDVACDRCKRVQPLVKSDGDPAKPRECVAGCLVCGNETGTYA